MTAEGVWCRACEADHPFLESVVGVPLVECANAPDDGWYHLMDTRYLAADLQRLFTGYDGHLWVRYAR